MFFRTDFVRVFSAQHYAKLATTALSNPSLRLILNLKFESGVRNFPQTSIYMLADWALGSPFVAPSVSSALCENTADVRASCLMRREDGAGLWDSFWVI